MQPSSLRSTLLAVSILLAACSTAGPLKTPASEARANPPTSVTRGAPFKITGMEHANDSDPAQRLDTRAQKGCVIDPSHNSSYANVIPEC